MSRHRPPLGPPETAARQAFDHFRQSGVVAIEYAGEIAEMRRLCREWADEGEPLDSHELQTPSEMEGSDR
ncbi:hypothetical protein [Saliphagus sp. LR7]|uniref:hypothetical protein n=1 Tax=Saliphagus sp. LR7 TaxID=2282654 RepID=UPI00130025A6|nr:hypothetical protein [Saliphagus sp. LR7]